MLGMRAAFVTVSLMKAVVLVVCGSAKGFGGDTFMPLKGKCTTVSGEPEQLGGNFSSLSLIQGSALLTPLGKWGICWTFFSRVLMS